MTEIERSAKHAQDWQRIFSLCGANSQWTWCLYTGLCETASWVSSNEDDMFTWSK